MYSLTDLEHKVLQTEYYSFALHIFLRLNKSLKSILNLL